VLKKISFLIGFCFTATLLYAQGAFSIATDLSILRSISKSSGFFAVGQNVRVDYHITEKGGAYTLVNYYTNGRMNNTAIATAKNATTFPQTFSYNASTIVRYRQISIGWKHFFKGQYDNEDGLNIYGFAGFGLLFGNVETSTNQQIDTTLYTAQPIAGKGNFKRLTLDIGGGAETLLGSGIYLYAELRTWFPASSYPSPYLYNNDLPRVITFNTGLRILID
jgi:hypothetical protein